MRSVLIGAASGIVAFPVAILFVLYNAWCLWLLSRWYLPWPVSFQLAVGVVLIGTWSQRYKHRPKEEQKAVLWYELVQPGLVVAGGAVLRWLLG